MPTTAAPTHSLARRTARVCLLVGSLILVLVTAGVLLLRLFGFPVLFHRVADHQNRVSIVVPDGWRYQAPAEGGSLTTDGGSSGERDPYRIPEIHAVDWTSDQVHFFNVEVPDSRPGADLTTAQAALVKEVCTVYGTCTPTGPSRPLTVAGHPAVEQTFDAGVMTLYLSTVVHDGLTVRFAGYLEDPDATTVDQVRAAWLTTRI